MTIDSIFPFPIASDEHEVIKDRDNAYVCSVCGRKQTISLNPFRITTLNIGNPSVGHFYQGEGPKITALRGLL